MSNAESARAEFERLRAELPQLGRGWTHMKKEAADQVSDEHLRASLIDPVKFRAMIAARERMEREEGGTQAVPASGGNKLHPAWEKSNAKLRHVSSEVNHGRL